MEATEEQRNNILFNQGILAFDITTQGVHIDNIKACYKSTEDTTFLQQFRRDLKAIGYDFGTTHDGQYIWFLRRKNG